MGRLHDGLGRPQSHGAKPVDGRLYPNQGDKVRGDGGLNAGSHHE